MKTGSLFATILLATGLIVPSLKAETEISVDFFYDHLDSHGSWFETDDYGYVWQPHDLGSDWSPYSDGRWVYTDAGWTWYSNEPYGWAVYHYGRWSNLHEAGWVWVPGTEWGPAWVSWRRSPRYVGWAPLPPEARFTVGIGFSSWVDRYYDIGPGHYRFVEMSNLGAPRLNAVFVDRRENITIINNTTNITNITYRDNIVYNGGPAYEEQLRASREPIPRYKLERRREVPREGRRADDGDLRAQVEGDTLRVADLPIGKARQGRPEKVAKTIKAAEVDRGWRDVGTPEAVAEAREKIRTGAELPDELPDKPGSAPGQAKGKDREKGERGDVPEVAPGLPPAPRSPAGKEMETRKGNLPPEPGVSRPIGERPDDKREPAGRPAAPPEQRPESKGTMKDPAQPGARTTVVPPSPGAPASPRPPAPGQRQSKGGEPEDQAVPPAPPTPPRQGGEGEGKGRMTPPPAPGGSATPPLPPAVEEGRPKNRPDRESKGPSPQRPDRPENAPARDREKEKEKR